MPPNQHGSYLIRNSVSNPGGYSLSLRDGAVVRHYKLEQLDTGAFFLDKRTTFMSIADLVSHYQSNIGGLPVRLLSCCIETSTVEIDRSQVIQVRQLSKHEFSEDWEGIWNPSAHSKLKIRIKKPHPLSSMTRSDFLQMASLMKGLRHDRIIQFYGVCTTAEPIYIITEAMLDGNLLDFFTGRRSVLTSHQKSNISKQVAEGMAYLENKSIVHGDLAARNILIGEKLSCKVANFETAIDLMTASTVFKETRFILSKWTAPEAATQMKFSIKSDVWSFGVFLYEVVTRGLPPYRDMSIDQVHESVQQGYRMPQPFYDCPNEFYQLMLKCWRDEPMDRPAFWTLHHLLEKYSKANDPQHAIFASVEELF